MKGAAYISGENRYVTIVEPELGNYIDSGAIWKIAPCVEANSSPVQRNILSW